MAPAVRSRPRTAPARRLRPSSSRSASAHTRRVYASALGLLAAWLDGRRLDDASLAAYLGYLHQAGRAPATAALAVAAVRRAARDAGEEPPAGPLTRQGLEGFRRSAAADAPARRGQARGLTAEECAAVLATCGRPRRTGRRPRARRDGRARWRRRRHRPPFEDESGRRSSRRPAPGRRLRGRHPPPAGGDRAGTRRFYRRSQRRPGEPPVCGRLRRGRPRGPQNLARRPRGTRRRAHRPRGRHLRRPARRRLEGRQHGGPLRRLGRHPGDHVGRSKWKTAWWAARTRPALARSKPSWMRRTLIAFGFVVLFVAGCGFYVGLGE